MDMASGGSEGHIKIRGEPIHKKGGGAGKINIRAVSEKDVPDYDDVQLWLMDEDLETVAIIDDYKYFKWHHKLRTPDSFKLTVRRGHQLADRLETGKIIIYRRGDLWRGGEILKRSISVDAQSGREQENWEIEGVSYGENLKTRVATRNVRVGSGYDDRTDNAESLIKYYVRRNVVNPQVDDRKIPHLILEPDYSRGDSYRFRARFQRIDEIVEELCYNSGLGWKTEYDPERNIFVLKIVEGKENGSVLFSPDMGNVESIEFEESWLDFESVQFVAGEGEGSDRDVGIVTRDDYNEL